MAVYSWQWDSYSVLEFRSSPVDDPEAFDGDGAPLYKVAMLAVQSIDASRPNEADMQKYARGLLARGAKLRGLLSIKSFPISKIPLSTTAPYQDLGAIAQLEDVLYGLGDGPGARHPYRFLYAAYASGADPDAGELLRADQHLHTVDGTNGYFTNVIPLPTRIAFEGSLDPQPGRNQFVQLSFSIKTARYLNA